ncbi:8438_t:CDS:2 [Funneliformis geosporum]|uniref:7676_t:CDS:1 n=1 Tax=Funneliformis geosporum TaxID=1117311 RepID=A0A9W4WW43_9GLOM|nr:8438_t:CDS:2 [Funneliformis geosporum]CAI2183462.1 7676_t:CDS:2 [Funneliformis geosporum]
MGKLPGSKRPHNFHMEEAEGELDKMEGGYEKPFLKTICNGLCENPFLFDQLDEEVKERLSQNARRLVEYVEFKDNNGGVKQPFSECIKNYDEKQKRQRFRYVSRTKSSFGVLNSIGENVIEGKSISRDKIVCSNQLVETDSDSDNMYPTKKKILPKRATRKIQPKISLSSIQRIAPPIIQEPNWISFIESPTLTTPKSSPLESISFNKFKKLNDFSYTVQNYSERTAIAAEGMMMLSTSPSSSSSGGMTTPEKETFKETIDSI